MLPFSKRSPSVDVVELDDDDLVVLADAADEAPDHLARTIPRSAPVPSFAAPSAPTFATPPKARPSSSFTVPKPLPPPSRATTIRPPASSIPTPVRFTRPDERIEDDVAGECLATIAASRPGRGSRSALRLPTPRELEIDVELEPMPVASPSRAARSAPPPRSDNPFLAAPTRGSRPSIPASRPSVPWARESRPAQAPFHRGTSSNDGVAVASVPPPAASSYDSVAPLASSRAPEPTVIVLREKPKTAWYVASGVVGALCAAAVMRFVTFAPAPAPQARAAPAAEPKPAAVAPAAPVVSSIASPVAVAPPEPPKPTVVTFDEAVSIVVPPAAPANADKAEKPAERSEKPADKADKPADKADKAAKPADRAPADKTAKEPAEKVAKEPADRVASPPTPTVRVVKVSPPTSSAGPRLPDGSYGLGGSNDTTSPAATPAPVAPASPTKKRARTPEQDLAEAQLKASMR